MPVEIKELIIRAKIVDAEKQDLSLNQPESRQEIIAACVEQVLKILERKKER